MDLEEHFEDCMEFISFCNLEDRLEESSHAARLLREYALGHPEVGDPTSFVSAIRAWHRTRTASSSPASAEAPILHPQQSRPVMRPTDRLLRVDDVVVVVREDGANCYSIDADSDWRSHRTTSLEAGTVGVVRWVTAAVVGQPRFVTIACGDLLLQVQEDSLRLLNVL